jgi:tetratricopeptide (TPR) repeat protein
MLVRNLSGQAYYRRVSESPFCEMHGKIQVEKADLRRNVRRTSNRNNYLDTRLITVGVCLVLAVIVWLAFGQALQNDFVSYDDGDYVYENPKVSAGLSLSGIGWAFTHVHAANWHPLTTISHMLDCQIYGLQPWGHHVTNVLLHALAAILLFLALSQLMTAGRQRSAINYQLSTSSSVWPCAFVAALFAVHPLRVESVAWVSELKDVLSGVFFMLTLLAYSRYARSGRWTSYIAVVFLFTLGLLCKPTLVTLPFVLLLLDFWPLGRWQAPISREQGGERSAIRNPQSAIISQWSVMRGLIIEKIPLFILSAVSCVVTVFAQKKALDTDLNLNIAQRAANAAISYIAYIGQMIYPARLTVFYPYGELKIPLALLAAILLVTISAVFFIYRKKYPFLLTGWFWYLGLLIPMIGLVQVGLQSRADRYTYLAQIGLYIMIVWVVTAMMAHRPSRRAIATIIGLLTIGALTLSSRAQIAYWRNSQSLWEHAIEVTSGNYIAYNNLATVLLQQKRPDAAIVQFQKAIEIKPDYENAYVSGGSALMLLGQIDQAIEYYEKALELRPNSAEDWSNLAAAQRKKGKIAEAIEGYKKAVALKPDSAELRYNLGLALAGNLQWTEAIKYYEAAIRIQPNEARFHNNLGVALIELGEADESLEALNEALRINPNYPEAHYNLGCVLVYLGRREEAAGQFTNALRLRPGYVDAARQLQQLGVPESP